VAVSPELTQILNRWSAGDRESLGELMPHVYRELHRLAHRALQKNAGHGTVQTTALVHEAYLRLIDVKSVSWQSRTHFYAVAANLMRNILVDFARSRLAQKRGGGAGHVELEEAYNFTAGRSSELVALDDALRELALLSERQARVVELKFFGGLTEDEIAEVIGLSAITVRRDWHAARAWLFRELSR
jgi:RNA polymerase sigma factor (TIGR02999 family)